MHAPFKGDLSSVDDKSPLKGLMLAVLDIIAYACVQNFTTLS